MNVELASVAEAEPLSDALRELYAEVYAEPPYCEGEEYVARFVEHFAAALSRPGFSLATAVDGDSIAGVAYGWTMPPGKWFSSSTDDPPVDILNAEKFAIMEWMVRNPYRRTGIGRRLFDLILADRSEPVAILASNPAAPARRIYERMGWQVAGHTAGGFMPPMDILALSLRKSPT